MCCTVSKWGPNNPFLFLVILILDKILKTFLPKEFFNEFWFVVRQHEYIYIAEIKIQNFYSQVILGAKQFFPHIQKMLIYAN